MLIIRFILHLFIIYHSSFIYIAYIYSIHLNKLNNILVLNLFELINDLLVNLNCRDSGQKYSNSVNHHLVLNYF